VAPPDHHLLVEPGRLRVTKGPRENRFRPAIDPLFRSAAQVFGPTAIGAVLTGSLDDGTNGLEVIKRLGGTAVVQDPAEALYPSMPQSAIDHVEVDHIVRLTDLPRLLVELTRVRTEPWTGDCASRPNRRGGSRTRCEPWSMRASRWRRRPAKRIGALSPERAHRGRRGNHGKNAGVRVMYSR
jgi:hypothetical protein